MLTEGTGSGRGRQATCKKVSAARQEQPGSQAPRR